MITYKLEETEVVLYKGEIIMLGTQQIVSLILTNEKFVFCFTNQDEYKEEVYPIDSVKMYKGVPQINIKGQNVELYLADKIKEFRFVKKSEIAKFKNVSLELLTGKTKAERSAQKVKGAIKLINDTLDIDIVKATGNLINTAVYTIADDIGKSAGKAIEEVGSSISSTIRKVGNTTSESIKEIGTSAKAKVEQVSECSNNKIKRFGGVGRAFKKVIEKKRKQDCTEDKKDTIVID